MPAFLTTSGLQKFAVATPESPMTVKYMAIGTGTGAPAENISALFNEVYRVEIPNPLRDPNQPKNLEFTGYIPTTVGGWTITELGIYDDSGVLVGYHLLDESIVKSSPDSALKTDMYPTFVLALSNASDVNLIVSSSIEFDHEALTGRSKSDSHPISAISGLQDALNQKTTDLNTVTGTLNTTINTKDAQNVKLSGNQAIKGNKSFDGLITSPDGKTIISLGNDGELVIDSVSSGSQAQVYFSVIEGIFSLYGAKFSGDGSLLSRASNSKAGVTVLNNTLASSATDEALTAAQGKALNDKMLGWNQTYQDVTSSRVANTAYTNSTGRPIQAVITMQNSLTHRVQLSVDGTTWVDVGFGDGQASLGCTVIIPSGFRLRCTGFTKWVELR